MSDAGGMVRNLAAIARALDIKQANLQALIDAAEVDDQHRAIADELTQADAASVMLGNIAQQHPQFSALRSLASAIATKTGAVFAYLPEAANTAGAWLAGSVPQRGPCGARLESAGAHLGEMLSQPKKH